MHITWSSKSTSLHSMTELARFDEAQVEDTWRSFYVRNLEPSVLGQSSGCGSEAIYSMLLAECISVTVENQEICINLPLGIGKECIGVPKWVPNGTVAKACIRIKYKKIMHDVYESIVNIPVGIKVCVYALGEDVACVDFGL